MSKFIFSTFFCSVVLILSTIDIFACTCVKPKPVEAVFKEQLAIFSGKVISIKTSNQVRKIRIRVEKSWKGDLPKTVTISTMAVGSMCGYNFTLGKRYLIYAGGRNIKDLSVSICSRTDLLSDSKEDIEILNNLISKDSM